MNPSDIKSHKTLLAWLNTRPVGLRHATSIAIAQRSALREVQYWAEDFVEPWWQSRRLTALLVLRPLLTLGVASVSPISQLKAGAFAASAAVYALSERASLGYLIAIRAATDVATAEMEAAAYAAATAADVAARGIGNSYAWEQVREDARLIASNHDLMATRLWSIPPPEWFLHLDRSARTIWAEDSAVWSFWVRWWDGILSGEPLDWELQKQVALIPNDLWEKGPAAVAAEIIKIEERLDLRRLVSRMRDELTSLQALLAQQAGVIHRSHNHPPEVIDASVPVIVQVQSLVDTLAEAEIELQKPAPDVSILRRLGEALINGAVAIVRYCGGLADTALKKAAEELGSTGLKWAIRVGGVSLATQIEPVRELGKAILDFAGRLAGS